MSQFGNFQEKSEKGFAIDLEAALEAYSDIIRQTRSEVADACDSPIELKLADALILETVENPIVWRVGDRKKYFGWLTDTTEIAPQYEIESIYRDAIYRVDFALVRLHPLGLVSKYVIECDGHDYHERTKQQAAKDRARDRDLQQLGWRVLRFTGSEIHADAFDCAGQILTQVSDDGATDFQRDEYVRRNP